MTRATPLALLLGLACTAAAAAGPMPPAYAQECGACHLAYPPSLLPAASWRALMGSLPRHFGSDASLPPATTTLLTQALLANAGSGSGSDPRITHSAWFVHEHRKLGPAWAAPPVKSAANCAACHPRAEQGDFDEHDVRLPR